MTNGISCSDVRNCVKERRNTKSTHAHLNPGAKETDDGIRALPELGEPGAKYYDEFDSPYMVSVFEFIEKYRHLAEPGEPGRNPARMDPQEAAYPANQRIRTALGCP